MKLQERLGTLGQGTMPTASVLHQHRVITCLRALVPVGYKDMSCDWSAGEARIRILQSRNLVHGERRDVTCPLASVKFQRLCRVASFLLFDQSL